MVFFTWGCKTWHAHTRASDYKVRTTLWAPALYKCVWNWLLELWALRQSVLGHSWPWHNSRWGCSQQLVTKGWDCGRVEPAGLQDWRRCCKHPLLSLLRATRNNQDWKRAHQWWISNQTLLKLDLCSSFDNENDTFHSWGAPKCNVRHHTWHISPKNGYKNCQTQLCKTFLRENRVWNLFLQWRTPLHLVPSL